MEMVDSERYPNDRPKLGLVEIINNLDTEEPATQNDVRELTHAFRWIGMEVNRPHLDLNENEMKTKIDKILNPQRDDLKEYDMFILVIICHFDGGMKHLKSSNGKTSTKISEIEKKMDALQHIRGLPKILILGDFRKDKITRDSNIPIPSKSDLLIVNTSLSGYLEQPKGSPFVLSLSQKLKELAEMNHLDDILTEIIVELCEKDSKQMKALKTSTLRKLLFLNKKDKPYFSEGINDKGIKYRAFGNPNGWAQVCLENQEFTCCSFKDGLPSWEGRLILEYPNGNVLEITLHPGAQPDDWTGEGVKYNIREKWKYEGHYKCCKKTNSNKVKIYFHGSGSYRAKDGSFYIGRFEYNKKNGRGTLYSECQQVIEFGIWMDNKIHISHKDSKQVGVTKDWTELTDMCHKLHLSEKFIQQVKHLGQDFYCIKENLEMNIQSCQFDNPKTFLKEIGFIQEGVDLFTSSFKGSYDLCSIKELVFLYVDNVLNSKPPFECWETLEAEGLEKLASKLGLTLPYANHLKKEWERLNYYPDLVSHFISMLAHRLEGTEVIDASMDISGILQSVGFNVETSNHLHDAILKDSCGLSLFQWMDYFIYENLLNDDDVPMWMRQKGNHQLGTPFQETITLPNDEGSRDVKVTWVNCQGLRTRIDEGEYKNSGSEADQYWYHSTTTGSAMNILTNGVKLKRTGSLLHLGEGFYVSNNFSSVLRYLWRAWNVHSTQSNAPGVVFVFKWTKERQDQFRDKRLNLLACTDSDSEKVMMDFVQTFRRREREVPDICKGKSLILARDTMDRQDIEFSPQNENQMCYRKKDAADELTSSLEEIWLVQKISWNRFDNIRQQYRIDGTFSGGSDF